MQTLVAAAIWGTGTRGFGPGRRLRVFASNVDEAGARLAEAVQILGDDGPVMAYEYLHGKHGNRMAEDA
jgi:hypothetical protein